MHRKEYDESKLEPTKMIVNKDDIDKALNRQIGGDHYKGFKIQPIEFIAKNGLSFLQGSVIKRVCRYNLRGEGLQDLRKAQHEIDLIIKLGEWLQHEASTNIENAIKRESGQYERKIDII